MARYIHCENCNRQMASNAIKYNELYEYVEGVAIKNLHCDGCPVPLKEGDKCFASVLLPDNSHPNYQYQKPQAWAHEFIKF